jgi:hypothetical protein
MQIGKTILLAVILLLSCYSGCMFLSQTKFSLISLVVNDDNGFPQLYLSFNASDAVTLTVQGPQKNVLFTESYYYGIHNENISLAEYRITPSPGTYTIIASDSSKNTIYKNELQFSGSALSLTSVSEDWWEENPGFSLIGLTISVKNTGDLPAYPYRLIVHHETSSFEALLTPTVVLPYQSTSLRCFVHLTNFSAGETLLNISLSGKNRDILTQTIRLVFPSDSIPTWEYQWFYRGGNTLKIPEVNWFYTYYKNLPRFDLADYAAYVFDPSDDAYLSFVADQLLKLPNAPTKDSERVDFIASFVQTIEYAKDDPLNDSYEYPRYPLETLKEQHGDCEDKAILTAALLDRLGYNVSLLRLPNHMAVGVHLTTPLPGFSYYVDQYYFLETTVFHIPFGKVPPEYQNLTNVTLYPISSRPLLLHTWKNATRYRVSNGGDYVQVKMIIENIGTKTASEIEVVGAFYDEMNTSYNVEIALVSSLPQNEKQMVELKLNVPSSIGTTLKTQLILNGFMVHQRESTMQFP